MIIVIIAVCTVAYVIRKDHFSGLCFAVFLMIIFPQYTGVKLSGYLPVLTIQRALLILLVLTWYFNRYRYGRFKDRTVLKLIYFIVIISTVSLFFAPHFIASFKRYISLVIESFLFLVMVSTMIVNEENIEKLVKTIFKALLALGVLGILENWTGLHPRAFIPEFEFYPLQSVVYSTFPHPIPFGISMAVGMMIGVVFMGENNKSTKRVFYLLIIIIFGIALYFSQSRGPWAAALIGSVFLYLFGAKSNRRTLLVIFLFVVLVLLINGGVFESIVGLVGQTFDATSMEGGSYYYRWQLWAIAFREISVSPVRLLFGYGLEYHRYVDIQGVMVTRSWDNEYATLLLEQGMIGFIAFSLFYWGVTTRMFIQLSKAKFKNAYLALSISVVLIYLFMMSNVKMFSIQNTYILYSFIAIGIATLNLNTSNQNIQHTSLQ